MLGSMWWVLCYALVMSRISMFVTTVYLHRTLTHRAMGLSANTELGMHFWLTMFLGINPREWTAVHKKHHHFIDGVGDPHSPHVFGFWHIFFFGYFYYRAEARNPETIRKYGTCYKEDLVDRIPVLGFHGFGGVLVAIMLFGLGWGAAAAALHFFLYWLLMSALNSLCHTTGDRPYDNPATNLWWLAWLTFGEAWHNNHHEHAGRPNFAVAKGESDAAWPIIEWMVDHRMAYLREFSSGD